MRVFVESFILPLLGISTVSLWAADIQPEIKISATLMLVVVAMLIARIVTVMK